MSLNNVSIACMVSMKQVFRFKCKIGVFPSLWIVQNRLASFDKSSVNGCAYRNLGNYA